MRSKSYSVLLIDDDEDSFVILRSLLAKVVSVQFQIEWVSEYDAGLEAIKKAEHDVVLLDYRLGARDGLELLESSQKAGCETPIILLTGQSIGDVDTRALQSGAADFINKSELDSEMLAKAIRYAIDRRQFSDQLRAQARSLERSNEELQRFAYVASHDLQEPLRTISSYLQLLEKRHGSKLDSSGKEFINFAIEGAVRMRRMIQDLLDLSRVETGGKEFVDTDLGGEVRSLLGDLKKIIEDSGARITVGTLPVVPVDPGQIRRVFQNLICNAIAYQKDQTPEISIEATQSGDHWIIAVSDNGIGIEEKYFDRIFVVFQRLHGRGEYPGTGMGLAITKRIIERHHGRIWVTSSPGVGSKFQFSLPCKARQAEENASNHAEDEACK